MAHVALTASIPLFTRTAMSILQMENVMLRRP